MVACAVLHNIAHLLQEPDVDDVDDDDCAVVDDACQDAIRDGTSVRNFIVQQYFSDH